MVGSLFYFAFVFIVEAIYTAYPHNIRVRIIAVIIRISCVAFASFANTLKALNKPCDAMQTIKLFVLRYIITNIKPAAEAYITWSRFGSSSAPEPFIKFMICPMPNVTLETMTAVFMLSLHIALNKNPLKMISSRKPTQNIDKI